MHRICYRLTYLLYHLHFTRNLVYSLHQRIMCSLVCLISQVLHMSKAVSKPPEKALSTRMASGLVRNKVAWMLAKKHPFIRNVVKKSSSDSLYECSWTAFKTSTGQGTTNLVPESCGPLYMGRFIKWVPHMNRAPQNFQWLKTSQKPGHVRSRCLGNLQVWRVSVMVASFSSPILKATLMIWSRVKSSDDKTEEKREICALSGPTTTQAEPSRLKAISAARTRKPLDLRPSANLT